MSTASKWKCGDCGEEFDTQQQADECEARPATKPIAKVGDIVLTEQGFGWFDGEGSWVQNRAQIDKRGGGRAVNGKPCPNKHSNCFEPCCNYNFYYVVTAIDHRRARWRYHLRTLAMKPSTGYSSGYTFDEHHYAMIPAKNVPASVLADAKKMRGKTARLL